MVSEWTPARRRSYEESRIVQQQDKPDGEIRFCPDCGDAKWTPETMRVHRWLAHDVRLMPDGSVFVPKRTPGRPRKSG